MQGRFKLARKNFRKAAKYDPLNTNVVLNLCDVEVAEGNHPAAVILCENFLEKQNDLDVHRRLLDLLGTGCRLALDKASKAAEVLLAKDTENHQARVKLGQFIQARSVLSADSP